MNPLKYSAPPQAALAQAILLMLGVPETKVFFGHKLGRSESNTKQGPGRKHKQGLATSNQR